MGPKQPNTGLSVGLNKGHIVTKKELAPCPSDRKGKTSKRVHFVRNVIREVAGFAPYRELLSFLRLERTNVPSKLLSEIWVLTREQRRRERRCPPCSARQGLLEVLRRKVSFVFVRVAAVSSVIFKLVLSVAILT
ncbi:60S ribosomal protein L36-3 [Artemisia annua]|uniref:60S ribosomal protein L36-3 n=1 Tax=Artemisia annua TaxID=35608 RepID=A0A2U1Q9V4_ARTAN|nr:60S ribosomal protein L36-3 [Artemisia annua]